MAHGDRFWSKVQVGSEDECWEWTAGRTHRGYGQFRIPSGHLYAHRVSYEEKVGPIPEGYDIDHLCRNTACVNPAHLEAVTHRENCIRGVGFSAKNVVKTCCPRGHEYDETNTRLSRSGGRKCRACDRDRQRVRYHALRAAA